MAKDYAKYHSKETQPIASGWAKRLALVIFVILVVSVGTGGYFLYKNKQNEMLQWVAYTKSFFKRESKIIKDEETKIVKEEPEIHFEFYTELPKMNVADTVSNNSVTKQVGQNKNKYTLQLGFFKKVSEADEKRISLLLLGLDTVDLIKTPEGYQLQYGSFTEFSDAKAAQKKLKKMGIDAPVKKE